MLLEDKVALITGTSRGIGKEIARQFALNKAIVYAHAREEGCIDEYAEELQQTCGTTVIPLYFDLNDAAAMKAAVAGIRKDRKRLDVLVNNAGIMKDALIGMINTDLIHETFNVNVFAAMELLQLSAKIMMRQQSGSIINISSIVGVEGNTGQLVYSASKGAVLAMTKTAAKELAPFNIRVNAIAPGMIDTDMFRSIDEEHQMERIQNIRMGRVGTPLDVARACVFFASELSEYVTGQVLGVDGSAAI